MNPKNDVEYLVYFIIPTIIFLIGIIGNILGLIVLKCKKLSKIGPIRTFRFLFVMDTIYLLSVLKTNLEIVYEIDLLLISEKWCKGFTYFLNSTASIPPMLLVYISIERFVSIKHPAKSYLLRNKTRQNGYLIVVVLFNFLFYLPILYLYELKYINRSFNGSTDSNDQILEPVCTFADSGNVIFIMIFTNRIFLPFVMMFTATVLLIHTIFSSRNRIQSNYSFRENQTFRKDIKFAFTSLTINVMFLILNLPFILVYFVFKFSIVLIVSTLNLFLISYAINFYLILMSNYLFRKQFYRLLVPKRKTFNYNTNNKPNTTNINTETFF